MTTPSHADAVAALDALLASAARQFDRRTILFEPRLLRRPDGRWTLGGDVEVPRLRDAAAALLTERGFDLDAEPAPTPASMPAFPALVALEPGTPLHRDPDAASERVSTATLLGRALPPAPAGSPAPAPPPGRVVARVVRPGGLSLGGDAASLAGPPVDVAPPDGPPPSSAALDAVPAWHLVQLADGYLGNVAAARAEPLDDARYLAHVEARRDRARERALVEAATSWLGCPYLWGGCDRAEGIDCSAFMQWAVADATGLLLPRDANQQVRVGGLAGVRPDRADFLPGDLLFFVRPPLRIYHVAMSLGGAAFIHADGRRGVVRSSLDPAAPDYDPRHAPDFLCARRLWA